MTTRAASLCVLLSSCVAGVAGCVDGDQGYGHDGYFDNEIVFGIDQTKGADGKVTTSVGYEMLDVQGHGSRARGVATPDLSCWAERLDDRLGQPKVAGGVAKLEGGLLPAGGVAIVANRGSDLTLPGPAWTNAGDMLTFQAQGFAMPDIDPEQVTMPSQDLALLTPADAKADVPVALDQDLAVTWTPGDKDENVVASLTAVPAATPNARGVELRCFFARSAGTGHFPQDLMRSFADLVGNAAGTPIKGKLSIATHRQLTIFARGGWTVYVVATAEQREQPFTLPR